MKKFIVRFGLFSIILLTVIAFLEINARENTYKAKSTWLRENKSSIEVVFFGSSHNWRAINPRYIDKKSASLAHSGTAINVDFLLFDKFIDDLPKLKCVVFEVSPQSFFIFDKPSYRRNHLYYNYYGVNNYGKTPPLSERLLIFANTNEYINRIFDKEKFEYNQWGFIEYFSSSRFFDVDFEIDKLKHSSWYINKFSRKDFNYFENVKEFDKRINICLDKNLKVILVSPPKPLIYNDIIDPYLVNGRDIVIEKYKNTEGITLFIRDTLYQDSIRYFMDEDHMSPEGAKWFSKELNDVINEILP